MNNQTLLELLNTRVCAALTAAGCEDAPALIQPAARPEFGDYQANGVMGAAKARKMNPRELAQKVIDVLDLQGIASKVEIAGPGFINITLDSGFLAQQVGAAWQACLKTASGARLASDFAIALPAKQCVVIDYSSPNLAKEMHVGHLRSTIIGDALARVLRFLGHTVIAQNHVGDWGTQFGMLTAFMLEAEKNGEATDDMALSDLEEFYRRAKKRFDEDEQFAATSREYVVKLQGGDAQVNVLWKRFLEASLHHCEAVYAQLGVSLTREDVRGESAYNEDLPVVVADLKAKGLAKESNGAQVVYVDGFANKEGEALGYIVQKQDGGYLYATTDLAAVRYRTNVLKADRALYVVDARQAQHFAQMFAVARTAGYAPEAMQLEHVGFGVMLGDDGKPFKTRSGTTVKLSDLLVEAEQRAFELVSSKNPEMDEATRREIAQKVGIGAVKYSDLSKNRNSDYMFVWDTILTFEGNTAPYLQYACVRVTGIAKKAASEGLRNDQAPMLLTEPSERQLALALARFGEALQSTSREAMPHLLCGYLYDLSSQFMRFYEACPVTQAPDQAVRESRINLTSLTAAVLQDGLGLLGIDVPEVM